jgi:hypothetical protein
MSMNCICGHPEKDHVRGGRCRVPDCPCELFRPGDTLAGARAAFSRSTLRISACWTAALTLPSG